MPFNAAVSLKGQGELLQARCKSVEEALELPAAYAYLLNHLNALLLQFRSSIVSEGRIKGAEQLLCFHNDDPALAVKKLS